MQPGGILFPRPPAGCKPLNCTTTERIMRRPFFGIGIIFQALGLFCFLTFWLMNYAIAFFTIGSILIFLARQKWYWKILSLTPFLFSMGIVINALYFETYLIPKDFTGTVYIITEPEKGVSRKYNFFNRVYEIPITGVLFTQFRQRPGYHIRKFYVLEDDGTHTPLGVLDYRHYIEEWVVNPAPTEPPRDSFAVFTPQLEYDFKRKTYRNVFTVGRYSDIDLWNYLPDEKIDSLQNALNR